ncbi:hypothetical protein H6F86_01980 [Phormidium sp. FACHB-592]|uniref:AbiTii domain-containing protein n=1 Tax=Stenomitos frigidus AS-A4 TaxID=2933935 RepID=A0ABV0KJM8_9CYAN|nr:hypothetical protein [Phormidium sp. FACHB-592]MBD2072675.1 hypothetical protein [Phormidium sp. FACHB-592]
MSSLVLELQEDALDTSVTVLSLLRKALVVARKLKIQEFQHWIQNELDGYPEGLELPQYRFMYGELKAYNPVHGWVPVIIAPEIQKFISKRPAHQPISQIESLFENTKNANSSLVTMPAGLDDLLRSYDRIDYEMAIHIDPSQARGVLEAVRDIVLNWSLKLDEDGILSEGMTFSQEEKQIAAQYDYSSFQQIINIRLSQMQNSSSESQSNLEGFNNDLRGANVANFANQVIGNARQQANQYNSPAEQLLNFADTATQIQKLLEQLSKTYSTETVSGRMQLATEAVTRIEGDSNLMQRVLSALQVGGVSALEQLLNHPAASFVIAALEDWQKTRGA